MRVERECCVEHVENGASARLAMKNSISDHLRRTLSLVFRKLGADVRKYKASGYENLERLPRYKEVTVDLGGKPFRVGDPLSFCASYREIFIDEIYKFDAEPGRSPVIVDLGANYGVSVVYFKSLFADCIVTAVEADPAICAILKANIESRSCRGVTILNRAVSTASGTVGFMREGGDSGRVVGGSTGSDVIEVASISLDELLSQKVDLLKMDIEGAEVDALCAAERLANVSRIFVEYHSFCNAEQTLDRLLTKLSASGFRYYIRTQFCSERPFLEADEQAGMDLQLNIFAKRMDAAFACVGSHL